MTVARPKVIIAIAVIAALFVVAVVAFIGLRSKSSELTGTVRHVSCINMGAPCSEDFIQISNELTCSIGPGYEEFLDQKVVVTGEKTIDSNQGGPKVCTIKVKSMRRV